MRDFTSYCRLQFLHGALASGVLQALPGSPADLRSRLTVQRPDLLESLLTLGVAVKELYRRDDRYFIRGARSRALISGNADPIVAMIQELLLYHSDVYQKLPDRLRGASSGDYLADYGTVIARSSRMLEPFLSVFVESLVSTRQPLRMLEIGCGSGIYLRYAAEANDRLTAIAVEIDPTVAQHAQVGIEEWGLDNRITVLCGDIRDERLEIQGPFDLVTLYNNIYYFSPGERPALFKRIRSLLSPEGRFALVSLMQGGTVAAADLDLALRSTIGDVPLPQLRELSSQLSAAGFVSMKRFKLMPGESLYGLVAHQSQAKTRPDGSRPGVHPR